jgi:hypothetical protein
MDWHHHFGLGSPIFWTAALYRRFCFSLKRKPLARALLTRFANEDDATRLLFSSIAVNMELRRYSF